MKKDIILLVNNCKFDKLFKEVEIKLNFIILLENNI